MYYYLIKDSKLELVLLRNNASRKQQIIIRGGCKAKKCIKYPVTEIHEILHGLNFAHVDKEESIMHPGIGGDLCTEIDEDIINCINSIYSNSEINCNNVDFILK